uniref:Uncharacterized protein n=1 Tax=Rhizophora mucronata TaxID=61149 RepID=A0A2P2Q216_RHIMU
MFQSNLELEASAGKETSFKNNALV